MHRRGGAGCALAVFAMAICYAIIAALILGACAARGVDM